MATFLSVSSVPREWVGCSSHPGDANVFKELSRRRHRGRSVGKRMGKPPRQPLRPMRRSPSPARRCSPRRWPRASWRWWWDVPS
jgi:hypothetical protein